MDKQGIVLLASMSAFAQMTVSRRGPSKSHATSPQTYALRNRLTCPSPCHLDTPVGNPTVVLSHCDRPLNYPMVPD